MKAHKGIVFGAFGRLLLLWRNNYLAGSNEISITKYLLEQEVVMSSGLKFKHLGRVCDS